MGNRKYQKIWKVVTLIPPGSVASYGQVADLAGLPANARLVSRALKAAPGDLGLPWHRVVNARLQISLPYATPAYIEQRQRLTAEGVRFRGRQIDRACHWTPELSVLLWQLDG
jgi:methylated-DNA-protein-cysteine methyltransferase-like protein